MGRNAGRAVNDPIWSALTASDQMHRRADALAGKWNVTVEKTSETETSFLAFGTRGAQAVVLKVVKRIDSRLQHLARALRLEGDRVLQWAFAQAVLVFQYDGDRTASEKKKV
jgi:streptomycin 6-kinase